METIRSTSHNTTDLIGQVLRLRITTYEFAPFVRNGESISKEIDRKEIDFVVTPEVLTHDTILWRGHYINARLVTEHATKAVRAPWIGCTILSPMV